MARIYVSSTFSDLKDYREQVRLVLRRLGHDDVAMEYYGAADERPLDRCLNDVAASDLYLGIFAWRYGFVPAGYDQSITELEFRKAVETGKECLIFLIDEDAPWPRSLMENAAWDKIEALRKEFRDNYLVDHFSNLDDLKALVSQAVSNWEKRRGVDDKSKLTDWDAYRQAVFEDLQWVKLTVIAGARHERIARIPLADVFVPQLARSGSPISDIPDEVLRLKRDLFVQTEAAEEDDPEAADMVEMAATDTFLEASPELVLHVLGRERAQVTLGGPGSGKSTLMHATILNLCNLSRVPDSSYPNLRNNPVPFLIELRQYVLKQASDFVDYIISNSQERYGAAIQKQSLEALFNEDQRALVVFDGLDEVFDRAQRANVIQKFQAFARKYPKIQIVVTSRIVGYDAADLGVAGFQHYTLLDFGLQQMRQFVPKWYQYYTWEGDERDAQGLIQRITESPRLMDLAGNPLLLTMMAVIYKHQDLPEQRWKLYERCTEVLLEDWDIKRKSLDHRTLLPLDIHIRAPQKAEILQRVSMYMLENGQAGRRELNAIAYPLLMRTLAEYLQEKYKKTPGDAEAIAKDILNHLRERTYILAEIGEGIFGFVHRTFMEYFAAVHCKAEFNARKADYEWLTEEIYGAHWRQDEWREVLLLLIAMLADQGSPIRSVVDYFRLHCKVDYPFNIAFAVRCLAEAGVVEDPEWAQKVVAQLVKAIKKYAAQSDKDDATKFIEEGLKVLSMLPPGIGVPQVAKDVIRELEQSKMLRERMISWQMGFALRSRQERLNFALSALKNKEEAVRRGAIAALEREWPGRDDVGEAIVEVVRTDRYVRVRQAALEALQRAWPENDAVLDAIERRIDGETSYTFLISVIKYLVANWRSHPKAFPLVLQLSGFRPPEWDYGGVREAAIQSIIIAWYDQPHTLTTLHNVAVNHENAGVRSTAMQTIIRGWPDHPETLPLLQSQAVNDVDSSVRSLAVGKLRQGWRDDPGTLPLLQDRAVNDTADYVRWIAIYVLAQGWSNNPETLQFLRDRLKNELDSWVKQKIEVLLSKLTAQNPNKPS